MLQMIVFDVPLMYIQAIYGVCNMREYALLCVVAVHLHSVHL